MAAEEKVLNRWIVVVGAILIQLCLGAIYAWSAFTTILTASTENGGYGFTAAQSQWIFSIGLAVFAIVMVWAGRKQAQIGPRPIAMAGGVVLGLGYILGGFLGKTFMAQLICIGVIGGAGIGLAYVVPIAVCVKWFPDKKGMITGLAVAGFGFGATIWVKLAGSWFGGLLDIADGMLGLPAVQAVFVIYGVIFLVCVLLGSMVMVNPPEGFTPAGWTPPAPSSNAAATGSVNLMSGEMLRTPHFYALFIIFTASAMAGLMVIGCIKLFGVDALVASGAAQAMGEDSAAVIAGKTAGTAMALYAILNGLGRIVWGTVSDTLGRRFSIFLMCALQGIMMLVFFKVGGTTLGLIVGACVIGFNFGGNFALFPAATADFFGNKNVGRNYGWVFLAYGVAGIFGPQIGGYFKDAAKGAGVDAWQSPFLIAGIACLAASAIALALFALKPPSAAKATESAVMETKTA